MEKIKKLLLSRVCAQAARIVREHTGRKRMAYRGAIGMAGCRYHSARAEWQLKSAG